MRPGPHQPHCFRWPCIKVDGTVSVPITIRGVALQHDYIVAKQITAEAILGLGC